MRPPSRRCELVAEIPYITWPSMQTLYITCTLLSMIWTLGDFNSVYLLTGGGLPTSPTCWLHWASAISGWTN